MKNNQLESSHNFGEFFRQKRLSLNFTLRSFCERFGYDPGNISRIERNILMPSLDDEKLAGYAKALQIEKGSEEWVSFHDLAHIAKGQLPSDLYKNKGVMSILPAFYRTARGEKLTKEKIDALILLLSQTDENSHESE